MAIDDQVVCPAFIPRERLEARLLERLQEVGAHVALTLYMGVGSVGLHI